MTSAPPIGRSLDVVCVGRAAVDLYGEQVGGRLEDMQTFARYLGGSPANTAVGSSRLGLRAGMITRVGDEHNGRFVRETLARERVDVSQVHTDPRRLTAIAILGIRDRNAFPLLFYREQCADMGLCESDVDPAYVGSARALLISGTHLSQPQTLRACLSAMQAARAAGTRVVLDIDYRPVLWNLTSPGLGEQRYIACERVSLQLQDVLPRCDLVVGTEEEIHIAGGHTEGLAALRRIRQLTSALIVMKRGLLGCTAFPSEIPRSVEHGIHGAGFPVEVFNVLGAGDAFMAGFLRGWVREEPLADALRYANACGAIVVSRHGCAPAMPSWEELSQFLSHGSGHRRLRDDLELEHLHRVTTRARTWPKLAVLAFDHRSQLEDLADRHKVPRSRIDTFKGLVASAAQKGYGGARASPATDSGSGSMPAAGVIIDGTYGSDVLPAFTGTGWWVGRPVEVPGSRPLAFEAGCNVGLALRTWPGEQVVKCLLSHHPDDEDGLVRQQMNSVAELARACRETGHELLLEVIPPHDMPLQDDTLSRALSQIYAAGVRPDWWKLPPPNVRGWQELAKVITGNDPHCRGVLLLGLEASEAVLTEAFKAAAAQPLCCGFAVGRSLFADAATAWFAGKLDDAGVIEEVSGRYQRLIRQWQRSRNPP